MVTIKRPKKPPETAAKKDAAGELVELVIEMIKGKELDPYLPPLDQAITARITAHEKEKAGVSKEEKPKQTKKDSISKPPVRKSASKIPPPDPHAPKLELTAGKTYLVDSRVKQIGGQKVEYVRPYAKNKDKSVVKMVTEVSGFPKGKVFPIPTTALTPVANKRRVSKK